MHVRTCACVCTRMYAHVRVHVVVCNVYVYVGEEVHAYLYQWSLALELPGYKYHNSVVNVWQLAPYCDFGASLTHTHTQVFHVPVEERRFQFDEPSFGSESRQSEIVRDIIEHTGCDIEMSQAKDRSLTIMVSGKPSAVVQARREILTKLQTQVSLLVSETCASYVVKYNAQTINEPHLP